MEVKKRNTIQRKLVLEGVVKHGSHPTADEIYEMVSEAHPSISKGTVYRNLNLLSEEGDLRKIRVADGADRFDHNTHAHNHIKCEACGSFYDVIGENADPVEELQNISNAVSAKTGFTKCRVEVVFTGICPSCS